MANPLDLEQSRFLVTGAASGIGRATCILLSRLAGRVIATDIDAEGLARTLELLEGDGHICSPFDLREIEQIPAWISALASEGGGLSGIVHAAGVHCIQPVRLLTPAVYRNVLTIHTEAALSLARGFLRKGVCCPKGGSLVFVSSVMAMAGSPGAVAYALSKAALIGLVKSLAVEVASRRIRANCVVPGFVRSPMFDRVSALWDPEQRARVEGEHPLGIGEPEDVANAIAFLLADSGRWITGTALVVDGGYTAH